MRREVCAVLQVDPARALQSFELTPYLFNLLFTIAHCMGDIDADLCDTLKSGAPTGVRRRIPPSGVWPPLLSDDESVPCQEPLQLQISAGNHASAVAEPARLLALIDKEIESGYLREVPGGLAGLQHQFGDPLQAQPPNLVNAWRCQASIILELLSADYSPNRSTGASRHWTFAGPIKPSEHTRQTLVSPPSSSKRVRWYTL